MLLKQLIKPFAHISNNSKLMKKRGKLQKKQGSYETQ